MMATKILIKDGKLTQGDVGMFLKCGAGIDDRIQINTKISSDGGSNYSTIDGCDNAVNGSSAGASATFQQTNFINVTTSNFRVRFTASSLSSGSSITGNTDHTRTSFIFKRLGDSQ